MKAPTKKASEQLILTVTTALVRYAESVCENIDGYNLLSARERESLRERILGRVAIQERVTMHASAWVDDVHAAAAGLVDSLVNKRIQRAVNQTAGRKIITSR